MSVFSPFWAPPGGYPGMACFDPPGPVFDKSGLFSIKVPVFDKSLGSLRQLKVTFLTNRPNHALLSIPNDF